MSTKTKPRTPYKNKTKQNVNCCQSINTCRSSSRRLLFIRKPPVVFDTLWGHSRESGQRLPLFSETPDLIGRVLRSREKGLGRRSSEGWVRPVGPWHGTELKRNTSLGSSVSEPGERTHSLLSVFVRLSVNEESNLWSRTKNFISNRHRVNIEWNILHMENKRQSQ